VLERHLAQRRHLAAAHLVDDLARLASRSGSSFSAWFAARNSNTPRASDGSIQSVS
jgi:hypothetical protein